MAARMDAMIHARVCALRMAAGSLETENLTASGGLNRLLGGLKELFPDFRSLEVFNAQGQPLALLGELSLDQVGKKPGLLKSGYQETGLSEDPLFRDAPEQDCFFLTLQHRGSDAVTWFSRARFSREPISSVLQPLLSHRNARLIAAPKPDDASGTSTSRLPDGPIATEQAHKEFFNWDERSFLALAPLGTGGWMITVERTFPAPQACYVSIAKGAVLLVIASFLLLLTRVRGKASEPLDARNATDVPEVALPPNDCVCEVPPCSDLQVTVLEISEETVVQGTVDQAVSPQTCELEDELHSAEECDPEVSVVLGSEGEPNVSEVEASHDGVEPTRGASWDALPAFADLCSKDASPEESGTHFASTESVAEPVFTEAEQLVCGPSDPEPPSLQPLNHAEDTDSVIAGPPILDGAIPDTLEVCWTEGDEKDPEPAKDPFGIRIVNGWYSAP